MKLTIVDERACYIVLDWRRNCWVKPVWVHHAQHGVVLCYSCVGFEQYSIPLSISNVKVTYFLRFSVDSISLNDGEVVLINVKVVLSKARNVDYP